MTISTHIIMVEEDRARSLTPSRNRKIKFIPKRNKSSESETSKKSSKDEGDEKEARRHRSKSHHDRKHKSKSRSPTPRSITPDLDTFPSTPAPREKSIEESHSSILTSPEARGAIEWLTSSIERVGSASDDSDFSDSSDESGFRGNCSTGDIESFLDFIDADSDEEKKKPKKSSSRGRERGRGKERGARAGSLGRFARSLSKGATDRVKKIREQRLKEKGKDEKKDHKKKKEKSRTDKETKLLSQKEVKKKLRKKKPGEFRVSTVDWDDDPNRKLPKEQLAAFELACDELGI